MNCIENQRVAMRNDERAYLLFSDHLGSSLLVRADGTEAEKAYYLPWGGTRGEEAITSTDYGYTGQMREDDIYYYGARWYDPAIGRFMQADTIVPLQVQGTQAFDRYAYVNNNPVKYVDPSGQWACANHSDVSCVETDSEFSEHLAVIAVELTVEEINDFPKYQSSDGSYMNVYEAAISGQILAFNQEGPTAISSQEFAAILLAGFSRVSLINSEIEKKAEGHKNPHTIPKFTSFSIYRFSFDSPFYNGGGKNYDRSQGGNGYDSDQEVCFDYLGCMGRSDANYSYQALFGSVAKESSVGTQIISIGWKVLYYPFQPDSWFSRPRSRIINTSYDFLQYYRSLE